MIQDWLLSSSIYNIRIVINYYYFHSKSLWNLVLTVMIQSILAYVTSDGNIILNNQYNIFTYIIIKQVSMFLIFVITY